MPRQKPPILAAEALHLAKSCQGALKQSFKLAWTNRPNPWDLQDKKQDKLSLDWRAGFFDPTEVSQQLSFN